MERLPVELLATICKYLQSVDIFNVLQLNKALNLLWENFDYWGIICEGGRNYLNIITRELHDDIDDLISLSTPENELFKGYLNANKKNSITDSLSLLLQCKDDIILRNKYPFYEERNILKLFITRSLQQMTLMQILSAFQDVMAYKYDEQIIAIYSPLIAIISNNALEIYELENYCKAPGSIGSIDNSRKSFSTYLKFITRLEIYETKKMNDIVKWVFLDGSTILYVTKGYGIYCHEIRHDSKRNVLKQCNLDTCKSDEYMEVIMFDFSDNLLVIGLNCGNLDIWEINNKTGYAKLQTSRNISLKSHSTITYEHSHTRKNRKNGLDKYPSPLSWVYLSRNCNKLLAIYKGIVNEIRIFSITKFNFTIKASLKMRIPLESEVQTCHLEPKGRFIVCVDSSKEVHPETKVYSVRTGKLLFIFNFRIISPTFSPCGHFMIGIVRKYANNKINKFDHLYKNYKSLRNIHPNSSDSDYISIWSIPSLRIIFKLDVKDPERTINFRFSRTRSSTTIITTTINKENSINIEGTAIKMTSNIYFISHDLFSSSKPVHLSHFFLDEFSLNSNDPPNNCPNLEINITDHFDSNLNGKMTDKEEFFKNKLPNDIINYSNLKLIYDLHKKGFIPKASYFETECQSCKFELRSKVCFCSNSLENDKWKLHGLSRNVHLNCFRSEIEKDLINEYFNDKLKIFEDNCD
ncbi:WD40-repeat containing protein [Cryptosporidium felis]|nr:WD40-repeat containing protein [Cryptosporidium felis]